MIKRFSLIFLLALSLLLVSCSPKNDIDTPPEEVNKEENTRPLESEETQPDTDSDLPKKPSDALEIIALADEFNLDTSLLGFSLDGILDDVQLKEAPDAGDDYQNSTAYLGDSVTLGLGNFKNHPKELVIAKGSISPFDALNKKLIELPDGTSVNFPDALATLDADRAILTFGANAISVMSEETFLNYYIDLIHAIKEKNPDCKIIIQSISPIASTCTYKKFTNVLINRANLLLLIMAYSEDVHFLNSAPLLKGEDGYLRPEYCSSDDGIHINENGYNVWINFMRTHPLISE